MGTSRGGLPLTERTTVPKKPAKKGPTSQTLIRLSDEDRLKLAQLQVRYELDTAADTMRRLIRDAHRKDVRVEKA